MAQFQVENQCYIFTKTPVLSYCKATPSIDPTTLPNVHSMPNTLYLLLWFVVVTEVVACNGNGACEPQLGETWENCLHDCCKTADCDSHESDGTKRDTQHAAAPEHPGVGHVHNRRHKVYRYHGDI